MGHGGVTRAQESGEITRDCPLTSLQTQGQLVGQSYDLYLLTEGLPRAAEAVLYQQDSGAGESCRQIGRVTVGGEAYARLGTLTMAPGPHLHTYYLDVPQSSDAYAASVLFIPTESAPCSSPANCQISFAGASLDLQPRQVSLNTGRLRLGVLDSPSSLTVDKVVYSVDNRPVYISSELKAFNLNYVSGGEHTLQRRVFLSSGHILLSSEVVQHGSSGNVFYFLTAQYYRYRSIVNILFILIIGPLIALGIFGFIYLRRQRKKWQYDHTANIIADAEAQRNAFLAELNAAPREEGFRDLLWKFKWWITGLFGTLAVILFVNAAMFSLFTVDGPSMQPTFKNGSKRVLQKLPVSFAKLNGTVFLPKRGDAVVLSHTETNLLSTIPTQVESGFVVKRVIGLPGERVVVKGSVIEVTDTRGRTFNPDTEGGWSLAEGLTGSYLADVTLGDNELFVVGDNRMESIDSRSYGPVKATDVVGRAL